ncbi:MAG: hypothetical protein MJ252_20150 [archaeon]|nr:hypothetical protein [archaeon]
MINALFFPTSDGSYEYTKVFITEGYLNSYRKIFQAHESTLIELLIRFLYNLNLTSEDAKKALMDSGLLYDIEECLKAGVMFQEPETYFEFLITMVSPKVSFSETQKEFLLKRFITNLIKGCSLNDIGIFRSCLIGVYKIFTEFAIPIPELPPGVPLSQFDMDTFNANVEECRRNENERLMNIFNKLKELKAFENIFKFFDHGFNEEDMNETIDKILGFLCFIYRTFSPDLLKDLIQNCKVMDFSVSAFQRGIGTQRGVLTTIVLLMGHNRADLIEMVSTETVLKEIVFKGIYVNDEIVQGNSFQIIYLLISEWNKELISSIYKSGIIHVLLYVLSIKENIQLPICECCLRIMLILLEYGEENKVEGKNLMKEEILKEGNKNNLLSLIYSNVNEYSEEKIRIFQAINQFLEYGREESIVRPEIGSQ